MTIFFAAEVYMKFTGFKQFFTKLSEIPYLAVTLHSRDSKIRLWMATLNIRLRWQFLTVRTSIPIGKLLNRAIII